MSTCRLTVAALAILVVGLGCAHAPPPPSSDWGSEIFLRDLTGAIFDAVPESGCEPLVIDSAIDPAAEPEFHLALLTSVLRLRGEGHRVHLDPRYRGPARRVRIERRVHDDLASIVLVGGERVLEDWPAGSAGVDEALPRFAGREPMEIRLEAPILAMLPVSSGSYRDHLLLLEPRGLRVVRLEPGPSGPGIETLAHHPLPPMRGQIEPIWGSLGPIATDDGSTRVWFSREPLPAIEARVDARTRGATITVTGAHPQVVPVPGLGELRPAPDGVGLLPAPGSDDHFPSPLLASVSPEGVGGPFVALDREGTLRWGSGRTLWGSPRAGQGGGIAALEGEVVTSTAGSDAGTGLRRWRVDERRRLVERESITLDAVDITAMTAADVDGDGHVDLVVAIARADGPHLMAWTGPAEVIP